MFADKIVAVGIALVGIGAGAFAAFDLELSSWRRAVLALAGLATFVAATSML
jgi:hypothetical protein